MISVKMDLESKVMGFQFERERSISSHEGFTKIVVMKVILRSEICLPGKIATIVFGESVEIAPQ